MTARTPRAGQAGPCKFCGCGGSYPNCPTREAAETCPWWSAGDRSAFDLIQAGIVRRRLEAAAPEMLAALHYAETVMMIVIPRSNMAEYRACLAKVRAAIALADPARPQDDEVRP